MKTYSKYAEEVQAIRSQSIVDIVYRQIQELVFKNKILPGERINEYKLAEMLTVSRAPIREACRQLEKEGLLEIKKNQGVFVKNVNVEEAIELYEVRAALEALAAELAAERAKTEDFDKLEENMLMLSRYADSDEESYFNAHIEFHWTIIRAAGNQSLSSMLEMTGKRQRLFRKQTFLILKDLRSSMRQHKRIVDALRSRNGKEAAKLMRRHILAGKTRILNMPVTTGGEAPARPAPTDEN